MKSAVSESNRQSDPVSVSSLEKSISLLLALDLLLAVIAIFVLKKAENTDIRSDRSAFWTDEKKIILFIIFSIFLQGAGLAIAIVSESILTVIFYLTILLLINLLFPSESSL